MTDAQVGAALREAGFRVFAEGPTAVIAERAVLGVAHAFRVVVCQVNGDGSWRCGFFRKQPTARQTVDVPERVYDYVPQRDGAGQQIRRDHLTDPDDLALWLGGACSIPFSDAEVGAIEALSA